MKVKDRWREEGRGYVWRTEEERARKDEKAVVMYCY